MDIGVFSALVRGYLLGADACCAKRFRAPLPLSPHFSRRWGVLYIYPDVSLCARGSYSDDSVIEERTMICCVCGNVL